MAIIKEAVGVFWGVILETGKRYSQTVARSFHISMATLEPNLKDGGGDNAKSTSVMIHHDNTDYLICNLSQKLHCQQTLDLNFAEGEEIVLYLVGDGTVHLTGYLLVEDLDEPSGMDTTEFDSEEEDISDDETSFLDMEAEETSDEDDEELEESIRKEKAKKRKLNKSANTSDDYSMENDDDESLEISIKKSPKIPPGKKDDKNKAQQQTPIINTKSPEVNKSKNTGVSPKTSDQDSPVKGDKSRQRHRSRNKKSKHQGPQSASPVNKGEKNSPRLDTPKTNANGSSSAKKRRRKSKSKNKDLNATKSP